MLHPHRFAHSRLPLCPYKQTRDRLPYVSKPQEAEVTVPWDRKIPPNLWARYRCLNTSADNIYKTSVVGQELLLGMTVFGAKQPFVRKQPPPTLPNIGETAYSNSICVCTDWTTRSKATLASGPARLLWRPLSTALRPARPGPVRCTLYRSERRSGAVDGVCEEVCAERCVASTG